MIIYTVGPYSGDIEKNIASAREWAIKLWEAGHAVICPHLNTAHMDKDCRATYGDFIAGDLKIISRCDAIFMLPGWTISRGAQTEIAYAEAHNIPVYFYPDIPPKEVQ